MKYTTEITFSKKSRKKFKRMHRSRRAAKERIVRECLSTRRFENCDDICKHDDRHHDRYIDVMKSIVNTIVNLEDRLIVIFSLHVFKECNTGFNSYTLNRMVGDMFKNGFHSMNKIIDMLRSEPIPERKALNSEDKQIFDAMSTVEREAMRGAFYDTIYKSVGNNSVLGPKSWYSLRYIDCVGELNRLRGMNDSVNMFTLVNPPKTILYNAGENQEGERIINETDRNRTIKDIVRGKNTRLPHRAISNINKKWKIEMLMFTWYDTANRDQSKSLTYF